MTDTQTEPEAWLLHEDTVCRENRRDRLTWLSSMLPQAEYLTFGGLTAKLLFEELRYCFVYGQFIASIMIGFAFIEHTLTAKFFMAGRDDLERAAIGKLLLEARKQGTLTDDEYKNLDRIRCTRNPVTHFRKPLTEDSIEFRSLRENQHPYDVLEQDARDAIRAAMKLLGKGML